MKMVSCSVILTIWLIGGVCLTNVYAEKISIPVYLEGKVTSARKEGNSYNVRVRYKNFQVGKTKSSGHGVFVVPSIGLGFNNGDEIKANFLAVSNDGYIFDYTFSSWEKEFEAKKIAEQQRFDEKSRKDKEKQMALQKEKENQDKEKLDKLLTKWAKSGPSDKFLSSKFQTVAGAALSGEVCTVVEFLDNVKGDVSWEKRKNNLWVLNQILEDDMSNNKIKIRWGFYDTTETKGYVLLNRVFVGEEEVPQAQLIYYVMKVVPMVAK